MRKIDGIGLEYRQFIEQELENGETYSITLEFQSIESNIARSGWFMSLKYNDVEIFTYKKINLCRNFLDQYSNYLPYGIIIISDTLTEPIFLQCFALEAVRMYIVDQGELALLNPL